MIPRSCVCTCGTTVMVVNVNATCTNYPYAIASLGLGLPAPQVAQLRADRRMKERQGWAEHKRSRGQRR
jgi:hypothetical protein